MNVRGTLLFSLCIVSLAGCQYLAESTDTTRPLAPPFDGGEPSRRGMEIRRDDQVTHFHVTLAVAPDHALVRLTDETGRVVLTFEQNGHRRELLRTPALPRDLPADDLIADLQLALWPEPVLAAAMYPPWTLERTARGRELRHGPLVEAWVAFRDDDGEEIKPIPVYNARHDYLMVLAPPDR